MPSNKTSAKKKAETKKAVALGVKKTVKTKKAPGKKAEKKKAKAVSIFLHIHLLSCVQKYRNKQFITFYLL